MSLEILPPLCSKKGEWNREAPLVPLPLEIEFGSEDLAVKHKRRSDVRWQYCVVFFFFPGPVFVKISLDTRGRSIIKKQ